MVMGRFNPADLIEWVGANFSHIYIVHKTVNKSFVLEHIDNANCLKILHDVLKNGWLVIDLLVTNAEERLTGQSTIQLPEVMDDERATAAGANASLDVLASHRPTERLCQPPSPLCPERVGVHRAATLAWGAMQRYWRAISGA